MAPVQQFYVSDKHIIFQELPRPRFPPDMKTSTCVFITSLPQRQWDHPVKIHHVYKYATTIKCVICLVHKLFSSPVSHSDLHFLCVIRGTSICTQYIQTPGKSNKANAQQMSERSLSSAENASKGSCWWITRAYTSPLVAVGRLKDDIMRTRPTADCHGRLPPCEKPQIYQFLPYKLRAWIKFWFAMDASSAK